MSFSNWVDTRIQNALNDLMPKLTTALAADTSPVVQSVVTGVLDGLKADQAVLSSLADQITTAVVAAVSAQLVTQIENIPQDTTALLSNELNQIPQQVSAVLDVPAAIAAAVAGLPTQIVNDIKGLIPFATPSPKEGHS